MRLVIPCTLTVLLLVLPGGLPVAAQAGEPVERAFTRFVEAFNTLDWETFQRSFAYDASVFNPQIPEVSVLTRLDGRESVEANFRNVFDAARRSGARLHIVPRNVRVQSLKDAAVVTFEFDRGSSSFGRRTLVFARQPDGWKIIHVHASNVSMQ
jgi:ketosteroid isomerase-like protein